MSEDRQGATENSADYVRWQTERYRAEVAEAELLRQRKQQAATQEHVVTQQKRASQAETALAAITERAARLEAERDTALAEVAEHEAVVTAPGVPSPQEDEAFIDSLYNAVENTVKEPGWRMVYTERIVRTLLPLFAARAAVIEDKHEVSCVETVVGLRQRAEKAEAELTAVTAERDKAHYLIGIYVQRAERAKAELAALTERVAELTAPDPNQIGSYVQPDPVAAPTDTAAIREWLQEDFTRWNARLTDRLTVMCDELDRAEQRVAELTAEVTDEKSWRIETYNASVELNDKLDEMTRRAERAEKRVAAERTQAAAQAWDECNEFHRRTLAIDEVITNPYRETP